MEEEKMIQEPIFGVTLIKQIKSQGKRLYRRAKKDYTGENYTDIQHHM